YCRAEAFNRCLPNLFSMAGAGMISIGTPAASYAAVHRPLPGNATTGSTPADGRLRTSWSRLRCAPLKRSYSDTKKSTRMVRYGRDPMLCVVRRISGFDDVG